MANKTWNIDDTVRPIDANRWEDGLLSQEDRAKLGKLKEEREFIHTLKNFNHDEAHLWGDKGLSDLAGFEIKSTSDNDFKALQQNELQVTIIPYNGVLYSTITVPGVSGKTFYKYLTMYEAMGRRDIIPVSAMPVQFGRGDTDTDTRTVTCTLNDEEIQIFFSAYGDVNVLDVKGYIMLVYLQPKFSSTPPITEGYLAYNSVQKEIGRKMIHNTTYPLSAKIQKVGWDTRIEEPTFYPDYNKEGAEPDFLVKGTVLFKLRLTSGATQQDALDLQNKAREIIMADKSKFDYEKFKLHTHIVSSDNIVMIDTVRPLEK